MTEPLNFVDWWRLLNEELGKLHKNQQALFQDARTYYGLAYTPKEAARALMTEWRGDKTYG